VSGEPEADAERGDGRHAAEDAETDVPHMSRALPATHARA
jgi:hypothetical protein